LVVDGELERADLACRRFQQHLPGEPTADMGLADGAVGSVIVAAAPPAAVVLQQLEQGDVERMVTFGCVPIGCDGDEEVAVRQDGGAVSEVETKVVGWPVHERAALRRLPGAEHGRGPSARRRSDRRDQPASQLPPGRRRHHSMPTAILRNWEASMPANDSSVSGAGATTRSGRAVENQPV